MTLEELGKRIGVLEDIEAIKKMQLHYFNCLTLADYDGVLATFSEDGVVDIHAGLAKGSKEREKLFKETLSQHHIGKEGNFLVHPIISVDGDRATGSWLVYIQFAQPRKMVPRPTIFATDDAPDWMQGFYENEYVKENGEWKISYLKFRCRLISPMQPSE